jgi:hypothetical protein
MIYLLHTSIAVSVFLLLLNGFLPGQKRTRIDVCLGTLLIGLLFGSFVAFGIKVGLLTIALTLVYAAVARPFAARLAAGFRAGARGTLMHYVGLPPRALERISHQLARKQQPGEIAKALNAGTLWDTSAEDALLDYCEHNPATQAILTDFRVARSELSNLYCKLLIGGAGQWAGGHFIAASAIAYPSTLRYLVQHPPEEPDELAQLLEKLIAHFERGAPLQ